MLTMRYVAIDDQERTGRSVLIPPQRPAAGYNNGLAVARDLLEFALPCSLRAHDGFDFFERNRIPAVQELSWFAAQSLLGRPTVRVLGSAVPKDDPALQ